MLLPISTSCKSQYAPVTQSISYNTYAVSNLTNYITSCQPVNSVLRQPHQLAPSQCIYQYVEEKEVYQIDSEKFGDCFEGFYMTFKYKAKEIQYSNEGFDKMYTNFIGIKT